MTEPIHACFIVDDVPANATFWMRRQMEAFGYEVPANSWAKGWRELVDAPRYRIEDAVAFADLVDEFGLRGKFTVLPCPAGLGRIDQSVRLYTDDELAELLDVIRDRIAPRFDITPEVLTHSMAYDAESGAMLPHTESAYISHFASTGQLDSLADYLRTGYTILRNVGLSPRGMTIGAMADPTNIAAGKSLLHGDGRDVFGEAILRVEREFDPSVTTSFMFTGSEPISEASKSKMAPEAVFTGDGGRVLEIHSLHDPAYPAMHGRAAMPDAVDRWVSPDGAGGEWIDHVEAGGAFVVTVHAQTLNSLNTGQGLAIVREALTRLRGRYGDRLTWHTTVELCDTVGV